MTRTNDTTSPRRPRGGKVYLVGAGPGDAGLITWRGIECLRRADVVLYDYLVNPQLLEHVPPAAERFCLGRHGQGHGRIMPQDEVNGRMIAAAQQGQTVVRLKGGDPMIFARAAEETAALAAAGVAFEIVPGITAALAVGSYAGVPLSHRDVSSAVALVTGHECAAKNGEGLDYGSLAQFPGTLVFYMGVTTAEHWSQALIAAGKPAQTPVALVRRCSLPDQQTFRTTLGELPRLIAEQNVRPPVVAVVGDVAGQPSVIDWFVTRPLFGRRVLVTRSAEQAGELRALLAELGADVLIQPAIEISPPTDWAAVDAALARLDQFDWLVFSSSNGVRYLLDRLLELGGDMRRLGGVRIAAIGPGTAETLAAYRLKPDVIPDEYRAEALAQVLSVEAAGRRFLLARASRGREVLAEELRRAGGEVEQVVVYRSTDVAQPAPEMAEALSSGAIDFVSVTSSAIARSLVALFGESLRHSRLVSISPITSATLRLLGYDPVVEAAEYTLDGVVAAILAATQND